MADNTQTPSNNPDLDKGKLAPSVTPSVAPQQQPQQPVKTAPPATDAPASKS